MRVLVLMFLLAVSAGAQDIQMLRLAGFTGLNTLDAFPKPTEGPIAHNVDLSRGGVGTIAKRYGFEKIDSVASVDSIVFMSGMQWGDGFKYMLIVGADPDTGWGRVYISNQGSSTFDEDSLTEIYSRFPITGDISLAQMRDRYYLTSGVGRGIIISRISSGFSVRPFPLIAPGEPRIVPMAMDTDTAAYSLNGTYRYLFRYVHSGCDSIAGGSAYTNPVKVENGRIYMTDWTWMQADTCGSSMLIVYIYRSKGSIGAVDPSDYAYYVGYLYDAGGDSAWSARVFIDSIPDSSLVGNDSILIIDETIRGFDENDTTDVVDRRYGAPGYLTRDPWTTADTASNGDTIGIYWGWPTPEGTGGAQGVSYACTFIDTLTSKESSLGAGFGIIRDQDTIVRAYTLSLPRPPTTIGHLAINLYRAPIRTITNVLDVCGTAKWDLETRRIGRTIFTKTLVKPFCGDELTDLIAIYGAPATVTIEKKGSANRPWAIRNVAVANWRDLIVTDTVYLDQYKLVAQISDTSTTYTDALRQDSLYGHRPYQVNYVPPFLVSTFAYNGRLYGADGNNLYRSDASDEDSWGLFEYVEVNPGSDLITAAWPGQFALRVTKQLSNYNIISQEFVEPEIVGRWGCIAPRSFAMTPAGPIYLSASGVVLERDGQYLERTIVPGIVSDKIPHILTKDIEDLKNARGGWLPREEQYWLNIGDTTWVWDWKATKKLGENIWTTSSVDFAGMTTYDPTDTYANVAGRTTYFWRDGDARVYRFGSGNTYPEKDYNVDSTGYVTIVPSYKTGPILWNAQASQIRAMNLLVNFDGAVADSLEKLLVKVYDQNGTLDETGEFNKLYTRYIKQEFTVTPELYYQLLVTSQALVQTLQSGTAIEAMEIYYVPDAEEIPFTY